MKYLNCKEISIIVFTCGLKFKVFGLADFAKYFHNVGSR